MQHWHLVYTPRGLADLTPAAIPYSRVCASMEMGEGGRHYHIYIVTDDDESTIRDRLKDKQQIPTGKRGKKSLHYSLRSVAEHPQDYPNQDLRKHTLGYTLKHQTLKPDSTTYHNGYTMEELAEAKQYYENERANMEAAKKQINTVDVTIKSTADESIMEQWAEYLVYFEKQHKAQHVHESSAITVAWFKSESRKYWRARNNGLFPQACKYRRFLASIIDLYRKHIISTDRHNEMQSLGY